MSGTIENEERGRPAGSAGWAPPVEGDRDVVAGVGTTAPRSGRRLRGGRLVALLVAAAVVLGGGGFGIGFAVGHAAGSSSVVTGFDPSQLGERPEGGSGPGGSAPGAPSGGSDDSGTTGSGAGTSVS